MIILHHAGHPFLEEIEHHCIDCHQRFIDNNRNTKRCPDCRRIYKLVYNRERAQRRKATQKGRRDERSE